jgi:hypothetical protein
MPLAVMIGRAVGNKRGDVKSKGAAVTCCAVMLNILLPCAPSGSLGGEQPVPLESYAKNSLDRWNFRTAKRVAQLNREIALRHTICG